MATPEALGRPEDALGNGTDEDPGEPSGSRVIPLGRGHEMEVRRLRPDDRPALEALFEHLSLDDVRLRFFSGSRPAAAILDHWFVADPDQVGRLVALEDGELVADAGWYRLPGGDAELDITVEAHHRGWLGPYLLDAVVEDARRHGIRNLVAEIDRSNDRMLALVRERGAVSLQDEGSVVRLAIGAADPVPLWPEGEPHRPRLLLEGHAMPWAAPDVARTYGAELIACHIACRHGPNHCPALAGRSCPLAAGADAVIVTLAPRDERADRLLAAHAQVHPGTRRFVSGPGWAPPAGVARIGAVDVEGIEAVLHALDVPVHLQHRKASGPGGSQP